MKKALALLIVFFAVAASAQKVKIKKDAVLIDEVQVYKVEEAGSVQILSSLTGKEFLVITVNTYEPDEENPAIRVNSQYKVTTLRFNESGKIMYTDLRPKDVIAKVYNAKMVDSEGNVDEKKLDDFIYKYNNKELKNKL
jgi:hypothetical protein